MAAELEPRETYKAPKQRTKNKMQ